MVNGSVFFLIRLSVYRTDGTLFGGGAADGGVLDFFILDDGGILLCYPNEARQMISDAVQ